MLAAWVLLQAASQLELAVAAGVEYEDARQRILEQRLEQQQREQQQQQQGAGPGGAAAAAPLGAAPAQPPVPAHTAAAIAGAGVSVREVPAAGAGPGPSLAQAAGGSSLPVSLQTRPGAAQGQPGAQAEPRPASPEEGGGRELGFAEVVERLQGILANAGGGRPLLGLPMRGLCLCLCLQSVSLQE
jgi:hypothetical protein